jgi:hypothetical protein
MHNGPGRVPLAEGKFEEAAEWLERALRDCIDSHSGFGPPGLGVARRFRCYGAGGEEMAPSSLQQTDGAPHATAE